MSAALPRPQPSFLGVGEQVVRRVRGAEYAGAEPAAQTINSQPTLEEFVADAIVNRGLLYGDGAAQPLGILSLTTAA